jgi:hypothetical protein
MIAARRRCPPRSSRPRADDRRDHRGRALMTAAMTGAIIAAAP